MKKEIIEFYSQYKLYLFPAIIALSSLFLIIFAIYPQTVQLLDGQKTASKLIDKSEFLNIKVAALENYNEADLSKKVGYALSALPAEKDYGNILSLLQQIVLQSGFNITSIGISTTGSKVNNVDSFEVKLGLEGSQTLLQTLLDNLDSSPRLIRIKSIDVSSNQNQQSSDVSLALQILYLALPQDFGNTDSPLPELNQKDEELISTLEKANKTMLGVSEDFSQSPRGKANPFE